MDEIHENKGLWMKSFLYDKDVVSMVSSHNSLLAMLFGPLIIVGL